MARTTLAAGSLNTRITIQQGTRVSDGQGGFTQTWSTAGQAWARKKFLGGGDTNEQDQTMSRRRFEYTIRRRSDVTFTQAMRVVDGSMLLDIKGVALDDSDLSAQVITAEEVPADVYTRTVGRVVVTP